MDEIYRNADITIINASGSGPDCGLPGVSLAPRRVQSSALVHGRFITTMPDVKQELDESDWSTRGCECYIPIR
jgi:hypothetical protein